MYRRQIATGRGGFTLAELMVALGVIAIAISMVASLFPTAIKRRDSAVKDSLGSLICRNGLQTAKLVLTEVNCQSPDLVIVADDNHITPIPAASQHYPVGAAGDMGFVVMGRRLPASTGGGHQLVVVSYRKRKGEDVTCQTVKVDPGQVSETTDTLTITPNLASVQPGSPFIWRSTGEYAFIKSVNTTAKTITLDREVTVPSMAEGIVVMEANAKVSPAMRVLVTRTKLAAGRRAMMLP